jgi:ActR/RegA family two-component response regulator
MHNYFQQLVRALQIRAYMVRVININTTFSARAHQDTPAHHVISVSIDFDKPSINVIQS